MQRDHRTGAAALVAAGLLIAPAATAAAEPPSPEAPRLVLSVDGDAWVQDITTPVFDPAHVWVPGDAMTYTVLFRNDSGQDAEGFGTLDLTGPATDLLATRLRVDDGPWLDGPRSEVVPVAAGQVVRLDMELALPASAVNPRQALTADLHATVTLRGDDVETGPGGGTGPGTTDPGVDPGVGPGDGAGTGSGNGTGTAGGPGDGTAGPGDVTAGGGSDGLALTGAGLVWPALGAAVAMLTGHRLSLLAARRRRRRA